MRKSLALLVALGLSVSGNMCCAVAAGQAVKEVVATQRLLHEPSGQEFVIGKLKLPAVADWQIVSAAKQDETIATPSLILGEAEADWIALTAGDPQEPGQRLRERQLIKKGERAASSAYRTLRDYAEQHNGQWPASLAAWREYLERNGADRATLLTTSGYEEKYAELDDENRWGFVHDAPCLMEWYNSGARKHGWITNRETLLVELRPLYDDGQHLVVRANGWVERVAIDEAMVKRYGWTIKPQREREGPRRAVAEIDYDIVARLLAPGRTTFTVRSISLGEEAQCVWDIGDAPPASDKDTERVRKAWASRRAQTWTRMSTVARGFSPPLLALLQATSSVYGGDVHTLIEHFERRRNWRGRSDNRDETSLLGMFGGQAAVSETLQLQSLAPLAADQAADMVALDTIKGVEVKSHPYEEMLAGQAGGSLALADAVPADRLLLYAAKPQALAAYLQDGAAFVARIGAMTAGHELDYGLVERYLARLGMDTATAQNLLRSGLVTELAIFLPDLFLIDGTEVTLVCRVPQLPALAAALRLDNLAAGGQAPMSMKAPFNGADIHLAAKDNLLVLGTDAGEVAKAYHLLLAKGAGSLGASAEFKYMLTQLPLLEQTRLYLYFSDSFIRRLVGPEVKIGQLRRMKEIGRLTKLQAARLLWEIDGLPGNAPDKGVTANLLASGYLRGDAAAYQDITWHDDGAIASPAYGTLGRMRSLSQSAITHVTAAEAKAYNNYRDQYERYWRQYFDPIAMRLDDTADGELQLTTFILPLIDNSLYNALREMLATDQNNSLRALATEPAVPLIVSFGINDQKWDELLDDILPDDTAAASPALLDLLNSIAGGIHIMVHDSNPIFAVGSGEMLSLGAQLTGGDRTDLLLPLAVTLFTRPCTIAVELTTAEAARKTLNTAELNKITAGMIGRDGIAEAYQVDETAWIIRFDIFSINVRLKLELRDNMLLLHNIPWVAPFALRQSAEQHGLAAQVLLVPGAAAIQQPAMFAAAQERLRSAALAGGERLMPFIATGNTVAEALTRHRAAFGFAPRHPEGGTWELRDGQLRSDAFGTADEARQPQYAPGPVRGLLAGIDQMRLHMRFENSGLRTVIKWHYNKHE